MGLALWGGALEVGADMSFDDMLHGRDPIGTERSESELAAQRRRMEAQLRAERLRRAREEEQAERRREEERRRELARPLGERLLDRHCTRCHTLEPVLAARYGWLGWQVTIARMRWWNGARLPGESVGPIVNHLLDERPAGPLRAFGEYAAALALLASTVAWPLYRRLRRRRARPADHG